MTDATDLDTGDEPNSGAHLRPTAAWTAGAEALHTLRQARAAARAISDPQERAQRLESVGSSFLSLAVALATEHINPPDDDAARRR